MQGHRNYRHRRALDNARHARTERTDLAVARQLSFRENADQLSVFQRRGDDERVGETLVIAYQERRTLLGNVFNAGSLQPVDRVHQRPPGFASYRARRGVIWVTFFSRGKFFGPETDAVARVDFPLL